MYISLATSTIIQIIDDIGDVATTCAMIIHAAEPGHGVANQLTTDIITGKILGYRNVDIYSSCCYCKNRVHTNVDAVVCPSCAAYVNVAACKQEFYCKLLVRTRCIFS